MPVIDEDLLNSVDVKTLLETGQIEVIDDTAREN
jgi:hypothetical protein